MFSFHVTLDIQPSVLTTDPSTASWLGATVEQLEGRTLKEVFPSLNSVLELVLCSAPHGPSLGASHGVHSLEVNGRQAAVELSTVRLKSSQILILRELQPADQDELLMAQYVSMAGDVMVVVDAEGRLVMTNSSLANGLGYERGHFRGRRFEEFLHPADAERSLQAFAELQAGRAIEVENRYLAKDGTYRWFRWRANPPSSPQHSVFAVARDITVERSAQDFEALVSEALGRIEQGVVMTDAGGCVRWCNAQFERITGYQTDEMVGRRLGSILQGEETDKAEVARIRERIRTGSGFRTELLNYRKNGEKYWVRIEAEPTMDAHGTQFFVAIETDITRGRNERERVRASEARLRSAINGAHEAIYWMDAERGEGGEIRDFVFTELNRAAEQELGKPKAELLGRTLCDLFPGSRTDGFFQQYKRVVLTGTVLEQEYEVPEGQPGAGSYRHRVVPVLDGVAIFKTNLTEQKKQEAAREHVEQELQRSQRMEALGRLAGGIAHDFNNVLATIMSAAEFLNSKETDAESAQTINDIIEASSRAGEFISEIMAFSRRGELSRKVLQPGAIIESTVRMLRRMLPRGILLDVQLDREVAVEADQAQLEQVLTNLVTNAWHAMSAVGGEIRVRLESLEEHDSLPLARKVAVISVADNGPGMEKEVLRRIREPFFSTKEPGMGTGLGLSVVDRIVTTHEGRLLIDSELGRGTTVRVVLPAVIDTPEPERKAPPSRRHSPGQEKVTVLLVDDEKVLRSHIAAGLSHFGLRVHPTETPEEALAVARRYEREIRVAIVDYDLQSTNGVRLAEQLRHIVPGLRVLLLTGGGVGPNVAASGSIDKVCFKPISLRELAKEVGKLAQRRAEAS